MIVALEHHGRSRLLVRLGEPVGIAGAQGEVSRIAGLPEQVVKIVHESQRSRLAERLDALEAPAVRLAGNRAAWPVLRVRSTVDDALIGHTMAYLDRRTHRPFGRMLYDRTRNADLPRAGWDWTVAAAHDLAVTVSRLGRAGVVVGDLAPANLAVTASAEVVLFDVGGWQVPSRSGAAPLPCDHSRGDYTAPEVLGRAAGALRDETADRWSLAVVLVQLLLLGVHPFAGVPAQGRPPFDEVGNIRAGRCWLTGDPVRLPAGTRELGDLLPDEISGLVRRCFTDGRDRPDRRPAATEWADALAGIDLARCTRRARHRYPRAAGSCPWCRLAADGYDRFPEPIPQEVR